MTERGIMSLSFRIGPHTSEDSNTTMMWLLVEGVLVVASSVTHDVRTFYYEYYVVAS
jgi:hypothetical protein